MKWGIGNFLPVIWRANCPKEGSGFSFSHRFLLGLWSLSSGFSKMQKALISINISCLPLIDGPLSAPEDRGGFG